jgi:hypothetical protein
MNPSHKPSVRANWRSLILLVLLLLLPVQDDLALQRSRHVLSGALTIESLEERLIPASQWHPFPRAREREEWRNLPEAARSACLRRGEAFLGGTWVTPKASEFLEYVRTGNRSNYERILFSRRSQLADLVLAECMEGKGRFLDDIVNGIWAICEETYWGVPAHVGMQKRGSGLPDVTEPTVDLFAGETASLLAWTYYLLKDSLDAVSPLVSERIYHEVERRIIAVNLERDDFWWMGFSQVVNNWNPWICSNWLASVLLLERDEARRARSVHKILRCLDNFLSTYAEDGGCDEGPSYWSRAGGSLFDCLELIQSGMNGKLNFFSDPLVKEIGRYIYRAHIAGDYFVNFADAAARLSADASVIYRYGRSIGDSTMVQFGAFLAGREGLDRQMPAAQFGVLGRVLPALFSLEEMLRAPRAEPLVRDFWLPGVEVMGARSSAGSSRGFYVAAQGGHNAESHNHNDVGNFIIYHDGEPVLIDVGVETYTARTFSKDRYTIWTMQSAYHNLPTVNGFQEKDGKEFRARNVRYRENDSRATLSMDIAPAFPREAALTNWERTVTLARGKEVSIRDSYELSLVRENIRLSLMTSRSPELLPGGRIALTGAGVPPLTLLYDAAVWEGTVEAIPLEDERLKGSWGEKIFRILLVMKGTPLAGSFSVRLTEQ